MKRLEEILKFVNYRLIQGSFDKTVPSVTFDSREVEEGGLFTAIPGTRVNGHDFIPQVIEVGVQTIVCEQVPDHLPESVTLIQVDNAAEALAIIAHNFYDRPSDELALVGITGTNGKTTTASLLYNLYLNSGYRSGLLSTIDIRIGKERQSTSHTTPDAVRICRTLREMADKKVTHVFMEVSSHALVQDRVTGLNFTGGIFTNISHEHLDYHKTFDDYVKAKKRLFDMLPKDAFALVNADDKRGMVMLQNTKARKKTFALKKMADYKGKILENDFTGMRLQLNENEVYSPINGRFNAYNILATYAAAVELAMPETNILKGISLLKPAQGRMEMVQNKQGITGIVDYAHSPDALENILSTIKEANKHGGQIFTVVGCGGDRDKEKRPEMARIAITYSDKVILTSDNPRTENPEAIIQEMETGVSAEEKFKALAITDREQAIKTAASLAQKGDIILVAGKGHEKYQIVNGEKRPFDDKQLLAAYLNIEKETS